MLIEGRNPILESLVAKKDISEILVKKGIVPDEKVERIIGMAKKRGIRVKYVDKKFLDRKSSTGIHQGMIAYRANESKANLKDLIANANHDLFIIYVREAQNEYNIGSIMRTAEAVGADAVILPPKIKLSTLMVRSAMGASEHINIINESLFNAIKLCSKNAVKTVGIEVTGDKYYFEADLTGSVMMIIGGEDRSLSDTITSKLDEVVKIPLKGKVNSLNMSIAASVVMYEKLKQSL